MTQEEKVIRMAESMLKAMLEREVEFYTSGVIRYTNPVRIQSVQLSYRTVYVKITGEYGEGSISFKFKEDDGVCEITDIVLYDLNCEMIDILHIIRLSDAFRRMCKLALDVTWEIQK